MNPLSKKFISLFLVFSLLTINCAYLNRVEEKRESRRKKHGANLIIQKINGQQTGGELIAVKQDSLLLLNNEGKDVSIDIAHIEIIKIVNKSKVKKGRRIGALYGVVAGALLGLAIGDPEYLSTGWDFSLTAEQKALFYGIVFGFLGVIVGGIVAGKDNTIQIEGMTDLEIQETLKKLRKKARIRDYK